MIETIHSTINIVKGIQTYRFPDGYFAAMDKKGRSTPKSRKIRKAQDIAFHNGDVWWERYTARLRKLVPPYTWWTKFQDEVWDFPHENCNLRSISFAEHIIDRVRENLSYRDEDGNKVEWLED